MTRQSDTMAAPLARSVACAALVTMVAALPWLSSCEPSLSGKDKCRTDGDCGDDRWIAGNAFFCTGTICASKLAKEKDCLANNWCQSNNCSNGKCM